MSNNKPEAPMHSDIVAGIIQSQIGTTDQSDLITKHMAEYFKRWPSYYNRLTDLEWYHLFLDFLDKADSHLSSQQKAAPALEWILAVNEEPPIGIYPVKFWKGIYGQAQYRGDGHWVEDHAGSIHPAELFYLRQTSSQPSMGLRWVKASERLPEKFTNLFFRYYFIETDLMLCVGRLIVIEDGKLCFSGEHLAVAEEQFKAVEWLEETPSAQPPKEDGSEAYEKWLNDPQAELKDMPMMDQVHVKLDSGAIARVSPDASSELLDALNTMTEKAMEMPIEGEQREWLVAGTPPIKDGIYNVITHCNLLIVDTYQNGAWDYDRVADGMTGPDFIVRYRPGTYQPLPAEAQTIADSKVVPASKPHPEDVKEVEQYIRNVLNAVLLNSEAIKFVEAVGALKDADRIVKELATWFTSFWSAMDEARSNGRQIMKTY